ncbi:60S ribosomal protein L23a [Tupaia chinensis]|uniref:FXYD domain-containing ion transport regulator n=1 Tax=Tupaia chinensis TaxID=246437 RepID=L8XZ62_TUPCH|nr:60S ribosomal protein L23a [Tupaia chinensis]
MASVGLRAQVQTPGPVSPEPKSNPETSTQHADETTQNQTETLTQQPTRTDALLTTDPGTSTSRKEGTDEDNPFLYDIDTLRKRGLLVAAVLFITGIAILTSENQDWSTPRRNKLDHYAIKFPLTTESTVKKIEDNNTFVFFVDVKANKHQITQAVRNLYDIDVAKVNTLIRPDGEKKAYV